MLRKLVILPLAIVASLSVSARAASPGDLDDLEIAHVAYTADEVDIRYAHLALAISHNPAIHEFARTMIRDHSAVNDMALALLKKLNVSPRDNFLSQDMLIKSDRLIDELSQLRGAQFDRRYAENEYAYHQAVNGLVEHTFIPNLQTPEVKDLFEKALAIFKAHEAHAEKMVRSLTDS